MKNIIRILKLVIPIAPFRMIVYLLLSLPGAVLPALMLYLQRLAVDNAANMNKGFPISRYIWPVLLLIGTYMLLKMFQLISNQYMEFGYFRYVFMGLDARIHEKSSRISLEYYDSAEYYQIIETAKQASTFLVFTANLAVASVVLIFNLVSVGGYLATLNPLLILFIVFVSAPVIIEKLQNAKQQSRLLQDTIQPARRKKYAAGILTAGDRKKELAHHGACHYVADKYLAACGEIQEKEQKYIRQIKRKGILFACIKASFHCMSLFLMIWLLITGRITIGGFSVLLASFSALTNAFTQLFQHAGEILQTSLMSSSFFSLMDFEVKDGQKALESCKEVARLEHISYRYPNSKKFALKDISLTIHKRETIAIVGENGAGKTTLAKLLSGFLLPTEGAMELSGIPRTELREAGIFETISALYQDFGRYKLTLAQNVYLGDTSKPLDEERILKALSWAGISFSDEPEKMFLGKEFGGVDLSGGQWQRLALARCYYRRREILFLDEPTAAIDPLEETAIYERLQELGRDQTVILVTHRLGAVRNADKIIVLEGGGIAEMGSFSHLMEQKGKFYHIWNEQVKWYWESQA